MAPTSLVREAFSKTTPYYLLMDPLHTRVHLSLAIFFLYPSTYSSRPILVTYSQSHISPILVTSPLTPALRSAPVPMLSSRCRRPRPVGGNISYGGCAPCEPATCDSPSQRRQLHMEGIPLELTPLPSPATYTPLPDVVSYSR